MSAAEQKCYVNQKCEFVRPNAKTISGGLGFPNNIISLKYQIFESALEYELGDRYSHLM